MDALAGPRSLMNSTRPASALPWYREPWPWLLMLGPALVVVAGMATIALAIATDDGVVADDYYKRGLAIDRVLARSARAEALGVSARIHLTAEGQLEVHLAGGGGAPDARPARLELRFVHPGRAADDRRVELVRSGDRYLGQVSLQPGIAWRAVLESERWRLANVVVRGPQGAAEQASPVPRAGGERP